MIARPRVPIEVIVPTQTPRMRELVRQAAEEIDRMYPPGSPERAAYDQMSKE